MKYAIISDIHANESALKKVLADARAQGAEKIVCLGDIVGYGPLPKETLALARKECNIIIAGNHDDAVSGRGDSSTFIDLAADAVKRHREMLSEEDLEYLRNLPYEARINGALVVHGDIIDPPSFRYILDERNARDNFESTESQVLFVGHTHLPALFLIGHSGNVYQTGPQDFTIEDGKRYIVNPGSVGYPRDQDGQCYSSYIIYDSYERTVSYRYLPFEVASMLQRGENPKRISKKLIALIAAAAAAIIGIAVFFLTPKTIELAAEDPALVLEKRELSLGPEMRHVAANLTLAKDSSPVQLNITFENELGETVGLESLSVKQSSKQNFKIPVKAVTAKFTTLRMQPEDEPKILLFAPAARLK